MRSHLILVHSKFKYQVSWTVLTFLRQTRRPLGLEDASPKPVGRSGRGWALRCGCLAPIPPSACTFDPPIEVLKSRMPIETVVAVWSNCRSAHSAVFTPRRQLMRFMLSYWLFFHRVPRLFTHTRSWCPTDDSGLFRARLFFVGRVVELGLFCGLSVEGLSLSVNSRPCLRS